MARLDAAPEKILVIRRDNIGDLVCTTPMIRMLRRHYPAAWIAALVTRYNAEVLAGNPDLDAVLSYQKAKHRAPGESRVGLYLERLVQVLELRRRRIDVIILPGGAQASARRLAGWLRPRMLLTQAGMEGEGALQHEVQRCARLLHSLGIDEAPPPLVLQADAAVSARLKAQLGYNASDAMRPLVALHISARKPSQRWPAERFTALMEQLHARHGAAFLLLWSPGDAHNPMHPGDDEKARAILAAAGAVPVHALPTADLKTLIAALGLADSVICSDGGAMHLAAGLGKPIVCFFGNSSAARWHPWGVPYALLQPESREVAHISVDQALAAWESLATRLSGQ